MKIKLFLFLYLLSTNGHAGFDEFLKDVGVDTNNEVQRKVLKLLNIEKQLEQNLTSMNEFYTISEKLHLNRVPDSVFTKFPRIRNCNILNLLGRSLNDQSQIRMDEEYYNDVHFVLKIDRPLIFNLNFQPITSKKPKVLFSVRKESFKGRSNLGLMSQYYNLMRQYVSSCREVEEIQNLEEIKREIKTNFSHFSLFLKTPGECYNGIQTKYTDEDFHFYLPLIEWQGNVEELIDNLNRY